jgi:predicted Zn-dependent protease
MSRIDALKGFLEDDPNDSFSRYALAMEYSKLGDGDEAIRQFETVAGNDPDYVATYYQLAKALERAGRTDDAAQTYRDGIIVATRATDDHTREELTAALELLTENEE